MSRLDVQITTKILRVIYNINKMNKNKKKIITIITIFLILIIWVASSKKEIFNKDKSRVGIAPPKITNYLEKKVDISLDVKNSEFNYPDKLSVLSVQKVSISENEAVEVAKKLNFNEKYSTFKDSRFGNIYLWKNNDSSLIVYPNQSHYLYTKIHNKQKSNTKLSDELIISKCKEFLTNFFSEKESVLEYNKIHYFEETDEGYKETTKGYETVYRVDFSPVYNKLKIIEDNPIDAPTTVWINDLGEISKVEIKRFGKISEPNEQYSIKNFEEVKNSLDKAVLMSIDQGNIIPQDISKSGIGKVNINKIELNYLRDQYNSDLYQPIFTLKGESFLKYSSKKVEVILYLQAIKQTRTD